MLKPTSFVHECHLQRLCLYYDQINCVLLKPKPHTKITIISIKNSGSSFY